MFELYNLKIPLILMVIFELEHHTMRNQANFFSSNNSSLENQHVTAYEIYCDRHFNTLFFLFASCFHSVLYVNE